MAKSKIEVKIEEEIMKYEGKLEDAVEVKDRVNNEIDTYIANLTLLRRLLTKDK